MNDHETVPRTTLALVGGRDFHDWEVFCHEIETALHVWDIAAQVDRVVSGGAQGADKLAERWAAEKGVEMLVLRPDWTGPLGKRAGLKRNEDIVKAATHVVAFPTKQSRGTWNTIRHAKVAQRPLHVWRDQASSLLETGDELSESGVLAKPKTAAAGPRRRLVLPTKHI